MNAEPPVPARCPICGYGVSDVCWVAERRQFLVECPRCTTFTITASLAARFGCGLHRDESRLVARLSRYLRDAGDDVEREITEASWTWLAEEAEG